MGKSRKLMTNIAPFGLRMQPDIKASIEAAAKANRRSMNTEIIHRLTDGNGAIGLRDWFAGMAIQARLAGTNMARLDVRHEIAADAYAIADAMLVARQSQEGEDAQ